MSRTRLLAIDLEERRAATAPGTSLGDLADGLCRELEPLLTAELPIPSQKARLTKVGGRCPIHGVLLDFDPWSPHRHRCPRCDAIYIGVEHDDWWAMSAQLYTAERAVHAAALFALRGDVRHAELAARILRTFAERYERWSNSDNALGPTRPFFSTYLESIWLLNICHALDLLEAAAAPSVHAIGSVVREALIRPSAALIASFHEGLSNRQVWNEVAVLSALRVLGDNDEFARRAVGDRSILRFLEHGLLDDGTWYEGENYHLFAHRGLWYGMQLMRAAGCSIPSALNDRYAAGFLAPFLGVLPDETLPSRRDSQYAVSIRQWRFAEWCELGYAHQPHPRLAGVLSRLYDGTVAINTGARSWSSADVERNEAPSALSRADLSWRALLVANPDPIPEAAWSPESVVLPSQGLAVLRRERGHAYVALEGGHTGSGHGHPDRLALSLQTGAERWLQDPGTGSYVEQALHWYRSTLAHHAPLVNGASQPVSAATLLAYEDRAGAGWIRKRATIGAGVEATRTVVACEGYLVDVLEWERTEGAEPTTISLALCGAATVSTPYTFHAAADVIRGAGGLEDGFEFLRDCERYSLDASPARPVQATLRVTAVDARGAVLADAHATLFLASNAPSTLLRARVPGAPGCPETWRHVIELHAPRGRLVSVWAWDATFAESNRAIAVQQVSLDASDGDRPVARVFTSDGTTALHSPAQHGWHIELLARHARSSVDLEGLRPADASLHAATDEAPPTRAPAASRRIALPFRGELGAAHYLRTDSSWEDAGAPSARLSITSEAGQVVLDIHVSGRAPTPPDPAGNMLDNERAEINADGVQWYWGRPVESFTQAALCLPSANGARVTRLVAGEWPLPDVTSEVLPLGEGWRMRFVWDAASLPVDAEGQVAFDLIINERPPERQRRRGQLVLSGRTADLPSAAAYSYLRGDRHDPARAVLLQFPSL